MSAVAEVTRQGRPYEIHAGPGCVVAYGEKVEDRCVDRTVTVLDNREHGFFVWLDCEEDGHVHQIQLYRRDRPPEDPIVYVKILEPVSRPEWEPVKTHKDPAVPG